MKSQWMIYAVSILVYVLVITVCYLKVYEDGRTAGYKECTKVVAEPTEFSESWAEVNRQSLENLKRSEEIVKMLKDKGWGEP